MIVGMIERRTTRQVGQAYAERLEKLEYLFIEAIMNDFRVKLLVETSATLSIISPDV